MIGKSHSQFHSYPRPIVWLASATSSGRPGRALLLLASLAASGCTPAPEGAFEGPAGFSTDESAQSALAPATLTRDRGRLVTRALRAIEQHNPTASTTHLPPLGVELGGHYDEGVRLVPSINAAAFVEATPLGAASHVQARLRHDGALVAYDGAYPGVSAALGANDERVETTVRVPTATDAPPLRYRLRTGPAFGRWQGDDEGARWAYDRDGRGLLRLAPPTARDATGRVVAGRWLAHEENGETVVEAELPWREMAFPVMASVAFETPVWYPAGGAAWPSPRRNAGLTFYGGEHNCAVLFGGFGQGPNGAGARRNDVAVRCNGEWQVGSNGAGIAASDDKPSARHSAPLAYAPFADPTKAGAYLFGGLGGTLDDLWKLTLVDMPDGTKFANWTRIPPPSTKTVDNWPSNRFDAGFVWTDAGLLLFGGFGTPDAFRDDTWLFDGTSWQRICSGAGCFPARRAFLPIVLGSGVAAKVMAFGGLYVVNPTTGAESNEIFNFTGSGWVRETRDTSAPWPTLIDGRVASNGEVRPSPRWSPWGATTANGQVVVGSGGTYEGGENDPLDAWRLSLQGGQPRWARVPVSTSLPGRRTAGAAVYDPVLQETLVVGGVSLLTFDGMGGGTSTLNPSPPVAYRGHTTAAAMRVTCHDPDGDGDCNSYTLEAHVTLPETAPPERARVVFLRQQGSTWKTIGTNCGLFGAPIGPGADGLFRCEASASLADLRFAVQVQDAGYAAGGDLCSNTTDDTLPFCNDPSLYAGVVACRTVPLVDGESVACGQ